MDPSSLLNDNRGTSSNMHVDDRATVLRMFVGNRGPRIRIPGIDIGRLAACIQFHQIFIHLVCRVVDEKGRQTSLFVTSAGGDEAV